MKHSIPHDLDHELARRATRRAMEEYRTRFAQYQPSGTWVSEDRMDVSFVAGGRQMKGTLDVLADRIDIEMDVPLLFRPFQKTAMKVIGDEIQSWINRARAGEL